MTFTPFVPLGGIAGWRLLNRTLPTQMAAFEKNAALEREVLNFKEGADKIQTAKQLVGDYNTLKVALGAFGLDEDISNKFFIQKILEEGTSDPGALANKMTDPRYKRFAEFFSTLSNDSIQTSILETTSELVSLYKNRQFEKQLGIQNDDMRLALNFTREIKILASEDRTNDSMWFGVMGQPPVRTIFEKALGLPESFASLNLDTQLRTFKSKASSILGAAEISQFIDPGKSDDLLQHYFARTGVSAQAQSYSSASIALTLLQGF